MKLRIFLRTNSFRGTPKMAAAAGFPSRQLASLSMIRIPSRALSKMEVDSSEAAKNARSELRCSVQTYQIRYAPRHAEVTSARSRIGTRLGEDVGRQTRTSIVVRRNPAAPKRIANEQKRKMVVLSRTPSLRLAGECISLAKGTWATAGTQVQHRPI